MDQTQDLDFIGINFINSSLRPQNLNELLCGKGMDSGVEIRQVFLERGINYKK